MAARVISIANQKGGVGKTTTTLSLGAALTRLGRKVLIMDLDPHANASIHMAFFPENLKHTAYDLFLEEKHDPELWGKLIIPEERTGIDFVASNIRLSELEMDTRDRADKGLILKRALEDLPERYDFILLDCPPHVGVLLVNALVASDLLIIPVQTDFLALHGLRLIFDTIRMLNRVLPEPINYRILPTMYDKRAGACRRVLNILRKKLPEKVFETCIGMDTKFREASAGGKVIFDVSEKTRGALEYMQLAKEILTP